MYFNGHEKTSFIDYPDKISTVLFTAGCNFKCPYCHNSELLYDNGYKIKEEEVFKFLKKRRKFIDGVCLSGGEATLHKDIYDFLIKVKRLDYLTKLDTNGTNPKLIKKLLDNNLLDYIAMDIKAPFNKYKKIVNIDVDIKNIKESIEIIKNSNIDYEFRTTICKELLTKEDILNISTFLKGSKRYTIQNFKDGDGVLEGKGKFTPYKRKELEEIKEEIKNNFDNFKLRY
ncbi:MAG: anaerobic ribonucleoside-triphosphate reductase activating protein [Firmicutes bacterium]|nr:anaerobic ribonucleoside-triphosphate reductase activating protein [Bacillota bacterium]